MTNQAAVSRSRRSGAARLWRGWTVAVLAVLLAAGGHQSAHSVTHGMTEAIPWELLGFSIALTAPVAVGLAGRGISMWATGLTTIFGQLVFHGLYSLPYTGTSAPSHGHRHGDHTGTPIEAPVTDITHGDHAMMAADVTMLGAHVLAAAVTTWLIVHGERNLVALVAWLLLLPVKLVLATSPMNAARPKGVLPVGRVWIPHPMNLASTRWSRGPPVLA